MFEGWELEEEEGRERWRTEEKGRGSRMRWDARRSIRVSMIV